MNYRRIEDGRKYGADLFRYEFAPHAPRPVFVIDNAGMCELDIYNEGLALSIFCDGEVMMTENVITAAAGNMPRKS